MNTANALKQRTRPTKDHRWTTMDKAISEFLARHKNSYNNIA
jgi:hypothetical protein